MPDLKLLFEERSSTRAFKLRNAAYKLFESTYNSESIDRPALDLAYRPNNVDDVEIGRANDAHKIIVNQVRRVVTHFGSMFSHRPRIYVTPQSQQLIEKA